MKLKAIVDPDYVKARLRLISKAVAYTNKRVPCENASEWDSKFLAKMDSLARLNGLVTWPETK